LPTVCGFHTGFYTLLKSSDIDTPNARASASINYYKIKRKKMARLNEQFSVLYQLKDYRGFDGSL
jgi:hypothetical protein